MVLILFGKKESDWTLRMDKLSLLLFLSSFSDVVSSFLFLAINISIFWFEAKNIHNHVNFIKMIGEELLQKLISA